MELTKVVGCNSANKSCHLQLLQTKAITASTQFCNFLCLNWNQPLMTKQYMFLFDMWTYFQSSGLFKLQLQSSIQFNFKFRIKLPLHNQTSAFNFILKFQLEAKTLNSNFNFKIENLNSKHQLQTSTSTSNFNFKL